MPEQNPTDPDTDWQNRAVVVSFVPLLTGKPGKVMNTTDPQFQELLARIENGHTGHVDGCVWIAEDNGVFPAFVMKDAHAVADHLLAWSDNNPAKWFTLCFAERQGRYVAALVPNVAGSVERFELAYLIAHREVSGVNGYEVIFRPLTFVSGTSHTYGQMKAMIPSSVMVGFAESDNVDPRFPEKWTLDPIRRVGPFPVCLSGLS